MPVLYLEQLYYVLVQLAIMLLELCVNCRQARRLQLQQQLRHQACNTQATNQGPACLTVPAILANVAEAIHPRQLNHDVTLYAGNAQSTVGM